MRETELEEGYFFEAGYCFFEGKYAANGEGTTVPFSGGSAGYGRTLRLRPIEAEKAERRWSGKRITNAVCALPAMDLAIEPF